MPRAQELNLGHTYFSRSSLTLFCSKIYVFKTV
jgi:hypothetical protein